MSAALSVENLSVVYDDFHALKDVSIAVSARRILRPRRRIRLRKIDAASGGGGPCACRRRHDSHSW